ncbi:MAG: proteasome assembly chaperone family protein [Nanoarchaeota archaeon]|nr:proteasome assembly chaperone family protein [Nanoarchaeota archaeon]
MKLILKKKPKGVTIIDGFPGMGLIGTIATEFLVEHLQTEQIGSIEVEEAPAMVAIHDGRVIEPISVHYNKQYNIVLIHAISIGKDMGWQLAEKIRELAKELQAKEILSLEGVGSPEMTQNSNIFYYSTNKKRLKQLDLIAKPLKEGIIVGATGALMAREKVTPITALFAETHSNLPDSKAAASIIKAVDIYLGLKVDPKPLLKQAEEFEKKLKKLMDQSQEAQTMAKKKRLSYVG